MMKHPRLFFIALVAFLCSAMTASAQDVKLTVSAAAASQYESGYTASNMIDGSTSTYWHSPWSSGTTTFPINLTFKLSEKTHVDYIKYVPRQDGNSNGNFNQIIIMIGTSAVTSNSASDSKFTAIDTLNLGGSGSATTIDLGESGMDEVQYIRIKVKSGQNNYASCSEMEFYKRDNTKVEAFGNYFSDGLFTQLKNGVTSADGIEDTDVKTLVQNLLTDADSYKTFRVGEYEAYRTTASLQSELRTSSQYCKYENPTGIYATAGTPIMLVMQGIDANYPVKLSVKNWVVDESSSSYALRNGLNFITPTTTGNCFINYYTDDFEQAPKVQAHFINGQVQGYWDQQTMTNADWKKIMALHPNSNDSTIIIVRSEHAQTAYPAYIWKANCPTNIDSTMTLYEDVQWAERDMMGLTKYGREAKNRQLFYGSTYGFMAAGGEGAYCNVSSLSAITKPDASDFDFWGVGHEWGHNNQITPGFKWSGCGETTNNIYASWAQIHFTGTPSYLRLEDEVTGVNDYSGMRGGRMQTYFEEGVRKGVAWQLQDGPDYHGATPSGDNNSRNYDHFVKLVPFWQLNLWGTLAGKCPEIIPMVIEGLRNTNSSTLSAMSNGQMQVNWMKMACDSAKINLLPFFEKAGMLKPINAYIEDYGAGWNVITTTMINNLKTYVEGKGYPAFTEEINYINGHNYQIYRDCLPLTVPTTMGEGCTLSGSLVKVLHSKVQNAVAYETYNSDDELIRITMYGLGSDSNHSYTQVLYPGSEDASYIMAVGYDGTREKIFAYHVPQFKKSRFYAISSNSKGGYLTSESCSYNKAGEMNWSVSRVSSFSNTKAAQIWYAEERDGNMYLLNPQTGYYLGGTSGSSFDQYYDKDNAPYFTAECVSDANNTWTFAMNGGSQYLNAYSATNTGYWSGGSSDSNNIWAVQEVKTINVSIPSIGYRACCYPFGLEVPEGVSAYRVGQIMEKDGVTYVVLSSLGDVIPSNTPAVLYKNGSSATLTMTLVDDYADAATSTDTNLLFGTTLKRTGYTAGDFKSVSKNSETGLVGFNSSTTTTMTANYAYLMADKTDATTTVFITDDDPLVTAIQSVDASAAQNVEYYDLQGRRVLHPTKGIFVTGNGLKILKR